MPYQLGLEQSTTAPEYLAQRAYMAGDFASIFLIQGRIARGTMLPESHLAIFGSEDLFDASALVSKPSASQLLSTFSSDNFDLKPGDYVVHADHGVAQFLGLGEISQGDSHGDYMLLEYAGGSKLYVPLTLMDLIQRFRAAGSDPRKAMIEAGERRLRPILMTALATVAGMIPLSLAIGAGSQMLQPLAIAVIGGIAASLLLSLIVTPAVHYYVSGKNSASVH